tara:strand:- start:70 stop:447 length:378 start_codon:yes stop_codon:yes gene_type:complete
MNKQYFEKLNTEKLAEFNKNNELQKVELGLVDDYKKLREKVTDNNYIDEMDAAKGFLSKAIKSATEGKKDADKAAILYKEILEASRDLGVELPKQLQNDTIQAVSETTTKDLKMMQSLFDKFKVR